MDAGAPARGGEWLPPSEGPFVFRVEAGAPHRSPPPAAAVPELRGENARDAAARLHASGFRVALHGAGRVHATLPEGGTVARTGTVVRLVLGGPG